MKEDTDVPHTFEVPRLDTAPQRRRYQYDTTYYSINYSGPRPIAPPVYPTEVGEDRTLGGTPWELLSTVFATVGERDHRIVWTWRREMSPR